MPIYNAENTLDLAIQSVLKQTYQNLRLVLVDDQSTDRSLEIAKSYTYDDRVIVYQNLKNRGAYYSRNVGLQTQAEKGWGYFTTHDADDISYEGRFAAMVKMLQSSRVNSVQDTFERKDYKTKRSLSKLLTIAHAMFKRSVFDKIGYFEEVRFGADWEYWARLNAYNKESNLSTRAINEVVGESFIHENNLTIQIPLNSHKRKNYIVESRKKHRAMLDSGSLYISFSLDESITQLVKYRATRPSTATKDSDKNGPSISVVLLTWRRIPFLKRTLMMLSNQTYKDFSVRITNANLGQQQAIENIANQFSGKLNISVSHEGNDIKAFRRFTVGREIAQAGTDVVMFIDDDISFGADYIERLIKEYEPKTYKSGFTWNFQRGGENYYKYRTRRWDNNEKIHYAGTGISMIDSSIFLDKRLFVAPEEAYYIEDLWLSYFAQHVLKWDLKFVNVGNVKIGGSDQHALYKAILSDKKTKNVADKADFLTKLIKEYKWKL